MNAADESDAVTHAYGDSCQALLDRDFERFREAGAKFKAALMLVSNRLFWLQKAKENQSNSGVLAYCLERACSDNPGEDPS